MIEEDESFYKRYQFVYKQEVRLLILNWPTFAGYN